MRSTSSLKLIVVIPGNPCGAERAIAAQAMSHARPAKMNDQPMIDIVRVEEFCAVQRSTVFVLNESIAKVEVAAPAMSNKTSFAITSKVVPINRESSVDVETLFAEPFAE